MNETEYYWTAEAQISILESAKKHIHELGYGQGYGISFYGKRIPNTTLCVLSAFVVDNIIPETPYTPENSIYDFISGKIDIPVFQLMDLEEAFEMGEVRPNNTWNELGLYIRSMVDKYKNLDK